MYLYVTHNRNAPVSLRKHFREDTAEKNHAAMYLSQFSFFLKATIHQAILLQAICGYFDVVSNVLPRIEHVSILGNSVA